MNATPGTNDVLVDAEAFVSLVRTAEQAADRIEALEADNARLRERLSKIEALPGLRGDDEWSAGNDAGREEAAEIATAALEPKP
jgi:hypothetical protein